MENILRRVVLAVLVLIFAYSALDKLAHFQGFLLALDNYVIMPPGISFPVGIAVIAAELWIAAGLLLRSWRRSSALLATILLAIFMLAIGTNHLYGDEGICGCWFTITLAQGTRAHLLLNGALLMMAFSIWWEELNKTGSNRRQKDSAPKDSAVGVATQRQQTQTDDLSAPGAV